MTQSSLLGPKRTCKAYVCVLTLLAAAANVIINFLPPREGADPQSPVKGQSVVGSLERASSGAPSYGCLDLFVTKLNATGSAIVYSTFLGDPDEE
jgi:hypothetical protein